MKHDSKKWILLLLACGTLLAGCNDEEERSGSGIKPATVEAFEKQFPDARNVKWAKKQGYDVATFMLEETRAAAAGTNSAWYPQGGTQCVYSKLEVNWEQLQREAPAVAQAWLSSTWKAEGYVLDDIDKKTYADTPPVYKLEAERGELERELTYSPDGTLLSDRPDIDSDDEDEEDDPCPQAILTFVTTNLPQAVIVESDREKKNGKVYYEVEIRLGNEEQELIFDANYRFLFIAVEVDDDEYQSMLPRVIYEKFLELAPDPENWDDVMILKDIEGNVLRYSLTAEDERTDRETTYLVDASGNLIE